MSPSAMRVLVLIACCSVLGSCFFFVSSEGTACDPSLASRDCADGLECVYSYDECPGYGCPRCRKVCRADADCSASDCAEAACIKDTNSTLQDKGVCRVCKDEPYWGPP